MTVSRRLALEWDRHEVRVLVLGGALRRADVEGAYVFPFGPAGRPDEATALAEFLRKSLESVGVSAKAASVVAGPGEVLLRHLRLPPAPDEELAGMVRFQASSELTATLEGAGLDYTVLRSKGDGQTSVLAAVLPAASMQRYARVLETAGLSAEHLVLRGHAASEALRERCRVRGEAASAKEDGAKLLVDFTAEAACLTVQVEGDCVLTRWRRLPESQGHAPPGAFLAGEVARTLTAFHAQFPEWNVKEVYLAGVAEHLRGLAEEVAQCLGRPVESFDPLELLGGAQAQARPEERGRFCALAGVALWEARGLKPPLDFLHPKQPAKRTGRGRRQAAVAALAALVLLGGALLWYGMRHRALAREMAALEDDVERLDSALEEFGDVARDSQAIRDWKRHEIVWLDEMNELSRRFPPSEEAYVSKLDLLPNSGRLESRVRLDAQARSDTVVAGFHRTFSQDRKRYVVDPKGVKELTQTSSRQYPWRFQSVIQVMPAQEQTAPRTGPAAGRNGATDGK